MSVDVTAVTDTHSRLAATSDVETVEAQLAAALAADPDVARFHRGEQSLVARTFKTTLGAGYDVVIELRDAPDGTTVSVTTSRRHNGRVTRFHDRFVARLARTLRRPTESTEPPYAKATPTADRVDEQTATERRHLALELGVLSAVPLTVFAGVLFDHLEYPLLAFVAFALCALSLVLLPVTRVWSSNVLRATHDAT